MHLRILRQRLRCLVLSLSEGCTSSRHSSSTWSEMKGLVERWFLGEPEKQVAEALRD